MTIKKGWQKEGERERERENDPRLPSSFSNCGEIILFQRKICHFEVSSTSMNLLYSDLQPPCFELDYV